MKLIDKFRKETVRIFTEGLEVDNVERIIVSQDSVSIVRKNKPTILMYVNNVYDMHEQFITLVEDMFDNWREYLARVYADNFRYVSEDMHMTVLFNEDIEQRDDKLHYTGSYSDRDVVMDFAWALNDTLYSNADVFSVIMTQMIGSDKDDIGNVKVIINQVTEKEFLISVVSNGETVYIAFVYYERNLGQLMYKIINELNETEFKLSHIEKVEINPNINIEGKVAEIIIGKLKYKDGKIYQV